jgi:hypothetical protein
MRKQFWSDNPGLNVLYFMGFTIVGISIISGFQRAAKYEKLAEESRRAAEAAEARAIKHLQESAEARRRAAEALLVASGG